jgi:hypothetical protein
MPFRDSHPVRFAVVAALLWTALLAFALGPEKALASGCRTDPVVVLTNGAQLQFGANIDTSYSNVRSVVYTVHAPARSAVALIIYTDNPLGSVEKVQFYADSPTNGYTIDTIVYTASGRYSATTSGLLVSVLRITLASGSASGMTGKHLVMSLNPRS